MGEIFICPKCNEQRERKIKGHCFNCWRKYIWKRKEIICENCGRERPHKAKSMCGTCHSKVYHYDNMRRHNAKRYHNISL